MENNLSFEQFKNLNKEQFKKYLSNYFLSDRYYMTIKRISKDKKISEKEVEINFKAQLFDSIIEADMEFFDNNRLLKDYTNSSKYKKRISDISKENGFFEGLSEKYIKAQYLDEAIQEYFSKHEVYIEGVKATVTFYTTDNLSNNTKEGKNDNSEDQITSKMAENLFNKLDEIKYEVCRNYTELIDNTIERLKDEKMDLGNSRILTAPEIKLHMLTALKSAKEEIDIISPWINTYAVDDEVRSLFESALKRGVIIKILYGINDTRSYEKNDYTEKMADLLRNKFRKYGQLFKISKGNTHKKLLICDNSYYIIGSMNFLSFNPDSNDNLHSEVGEYREDTINLQQYRTRYFSF